MNIYFKFFIFWILSIAQLQSTYAQQAIIFDSLNAPTSILTDDAVYLQSDILVKADYAGNILWAKDISADCVTPAGDRIYIGYKDSLIALDTAGNILWSLEFNDTLHCITDSVTILTIAASSDRVYIGMRDVNHPAPAIVTLDTSGSIINAICGEINLLEYYPEESIISADGGCWMGFYKNTTTGFYRTTKIGMNGMVDLVTSHEIIGANLVPRSFLQTPDSSHILLGSYVSVRDLFFLFKESDDGQSEMGWEYWGPPFAFTSIYAEGIDAIGNIYVLCQANGFGIVKIDPAGNILLARSWSSASQSGFELSALRGDIHFKNDSIYLACLIDGRPAILSLDTNLNAACYNPDETLSLSIHPINITDILNFNETQFGYTPFQSAATIPVASFGPATPSCIMTETGEIPATSLLNPYPNPSADVLKIKGSDCNDFELLDINGSRQKIHCHCEDSQLIFRLPKLTAGIYFLKNKITLSTYKIIKQGE